MLFYLIKITFREVVYFFTYIITGLNPCRIWCELHLRRSHRLTQRNRLAALTVCLKVNGCDSSRSFGPKLHVLWTGLHRNYGKNKTIPVKLIAQRKGHRHITLQRARNNVHTKVSFVTKHVPLSQVNYKAIDK